MLTMTTLRERFWSKVDVRGPAECWHWTGARVPNGYGSLGRVPVDGRIASQVGAHRVAFYLTHGAWPHIARHLCDNKICVNPAHILDGSVKDNVRDAVERGRFPGNGFKYWTECKNGHPFDEVNTAIRPSTGQRICRECRRESVRKSRARKATV